MAPFLFYFMLTNLVLGLFNLLPIPPLDGGRIAVGLLPLPLARRWAQLERAGIVLVVLLVFLLPPLLREFGIAFDPFRDTLDAVLPWAFRVLFYLSGHAIGGADAVQHALSARHADAGRHPRLCRALDWKSWMPTCVGMTDVARLSPMSDAPDSLVLHLEGFDGPLDLLLELARAQKVDLAKISILSLVEQYLAVIEGARRVRLELAADWLVMAAWLTWLKSRLLLPADARGAEEAEEAAEVLALRLRDLSAIRAAAAWLGARPQLGQDVFARGAPEDHTEIDRSRLALDLGSLVRAYLGARAARHANRAATGRGR